MDSRYVAIRYAIVETTNSRYAGFTGLDEPDFKDRLKEAESLAECKPAEQDPAGHWGPVFNGLQLSIRFTNSVLRTSQPIAPFIILRNTTTNDIVWSDFGSAASVKLIVADEQNTLLWSTPPPKQVSGPRGMCLPGMRQVKYCFDLQNVITNTGTYKVSAAWKGIPDAKAGWPGLCSGTAALKIISAP